MRPAVFFDRDGTLNEEVGYAGRLEDFHIFEAAAPAVRRVNQAGWAAVVVTNQAGVAKGKYPESAVATLHAALKAHLGERGARLDGLYYCPHHPEGTVAGYGGACECRKPRPGMLLQAARELDLDLSASWVIGDRDVDVGLARAAGARAVLVRTGYGPTEAARLQIEGAEPQPDHIADDVAAAVEWILTEAA